ncbi:MAG: AraC family transcriptional regulator [Gammaproteobacteria bacterium]|nr:AraC family transcriptional regulator [Gammaproteobacteria bacterium]
MDALSQVLSSLRMESTILSHFELREPWGLHCPRHPGAPFYAVIEGSGWLSPEAGPALPMSAGDFIVLPHGQPHTVASPIRARVEPLLDALIAQEVPIWMPGDDSKISHFRYGGDGAITRILAGAFYFGPQDTPLTRELPPLVRLDNADARVWPLLNAALGFIADEQQTQAPGAAAATALLADLIFLQVLRAHWSRPESGPPGLLRGLGDVRLRKAIEAMHRAPRETWTVPRLARLAGMSRSGFAAQFQERVGTSPKMYLTRWRMQLAAARLADDGLPLAQVAEQVGYRSVFAFAKCFRRVHGVPPGRYRRQRAAAD